VSLTNLALQGRSHDVINHMTIQLAIYYFLLVSHWSQASIFKRFSRYLHGGTAAAVPLPFRPGKPAISVSRPLVTPY